MVIPIDTKKYLKNSVPFHELIKEQKQFPDKLDVEMQFLNLIKNTHKMNKPQKHPHIHTKSCNNFLCNGKKRKAF